MQIHINKAPTSTVQASILAINHTPTESGGEIHHSDRFTSNTARICNMHTYTPKHTLQPVYDMHFACWVSSQLLKSPNYLHKIKFDRHFYIFTVGTSKFFILYAATLADWRRDRGEIANEHVCSSQKISGKYMALVVQWIVWWCDYKAS